MHVLTGKSWDVKKKISEGILEGKVKSSHENHAPSWESFQPPMFPCNSEYFLRRRLTSVRKIWCLGSLCFHCESHTHKYRSELQDLEVCVPISIPISTFIYTQESGTPFSAFWLQLLNRTLQLLVAKIRAAKLNLTLQVLMAEHYLLSKLHLGTQCSNRSLYLKTIALNHQQCRLCFHCMYTSQQLLLPEALSQV